MNIISKISLRKALRFFLFLTVAFTALSATTLRADDKDQKENPDKTEHKNKKENNEDKSDGYGIGWVIGAGVLGAILAGVGVYFLVGRSDKEEA